METTQIIAQLTEQYESLKKKGKVNAVTDSAIENLKTMVREIEETSESVGNEYGQLIAVIDRVNYQENQARQAVIKSLAEKIDKLPEQIEKAKAVLTAMERELSEGKTNLEAMDKDFGIWWQSVQANKDKMHDAYIEQIKPIKANYEKVAKALIDTLTSAIKALGGMV